MSDIARDFVATLHARGVTFSLWKDKRLRLHPSQSYRELSAEEWATLKAHRSEIKAIVAGRSAETAPETTPRAHEDGAGTTIGTGPGSTYSPEPERPEQPTYIGNSITLDEWRERERRPRPTPPRLADSPITGD